MPDREKVISEFSECVQRGGWIHCGNCEYKNANSLLTCEPLAKEILALLKEQETKLICNLLGGQPYEVYCRECRTVLCILGKGETMNDVKSIFSYCPHCGRKVKWNA